MSTLIQIETARLTLQLLTLEQVELYLLGNNLLEKKNAFAKRKPRGRCTF